MKRMFFLGKKPTCVKGGTANATVEIIIKTNAPVEIKFHNH